MNDETPVSAGSTPPARDDAPDAEPGIAGFVPVGPDGVSVPVYTASDRPRGLDAEFAPGGDDDATPDRRADERRLLRLLVLMIALLVGIPTVLTLIAVIGQLASMRGGG